jgi:GT2 family glycosyltransferase
LENREINNATISVSIVIVTYNCETVITDCVLSCLNNGASEVIVIDNDSKDETINAVNKISDPRLVVIQNSKNLGFTKACNQGIERAKGFYIMLLNPDASVQSDTFCLLIKYLQENSEVGIAAPCLYYPNGEFQNYTRTFPTVTGLWVESFIPMKYWNFFKSYRKYTCQDVDFSRTAPVEQPAGAALMMRHKWKLDERYFIYGSDVDLCKLVVDKGYTVIQLPNARIIHHQSKGGTENNSLRSFLKADNYYGMSYYFKKHKQYFNWISYRILFTFSLLLRFTISCFQDPIERKERWSLLKAFVLNYNFEALWKQKSVN